MQNLTPNTPIYEIAKIIRKDWENVYFGAKPYLEAMSFLNTITDTYGYDDAKTIIIYFLSNASSWKGETAREIKMHLKSIIS
jgi:hypothetical protein